MAALDSFIERTTAPLEHATGMGRAINTAVAWTGVHTRCVTDADVIRGIRPEFWSGVRGIASCPEQLRMLSEIANDSELTRVDQRYLLAHIGVPAKFGTERLAAFRGAPTAERLLHALYLAERLNLIASSGFRAYIQPGANPITADVTAAMILLDDANVGLHLNADDATHYPTIGGALAELCNRTVTTEADMAITSNGQHLRFEYSGAHPESKVCGRVYKYVGGDEFLTEAGARVRLVAWRRILSTPVESFADDRPCQHNSVKPARNVELPPAFPFPLPRPRKPESPWIDPDRCSRITKRSGQCSHYAKYPDRTCRTHHEFDLANPDHPSVPCELAWLGRPHPKPGQWVTFEHPYVIDNKPISIWRRLTDSLWLAPGVEARTLPGWYYGGFSAHDTDPETTKHSYLA